MTYRRKSQLWIGLVVVLMGGAHQALGQVGLQAALLLLSVAFACELIDSGLGMGYGTILTPTLLLMGFAPEIVVPAILFSELLSGFAADPAALGLLV